MDQPFPRATVALLSALSLSSYVVRSNISVAGKLMMPELGLGTVEMGQVFAGFMAGYALFQIPAGWLGDRYGSRPVLTAAALGWALFTALSGELPGRLGVSPLFVLVATRLLLGVAAAAMYPVAGRAVATLVPSASRSFANSLVVGGMALGSALTPPVISWLMLHQGWRASFFWTALLPLVIALAWWFHVPGARMGRPDQPHGWRRIPSRGALSLLSLSYFLDSYIQFIFLFWFYLYLVDQRGFSLAAGGWFTSLPYLAAIFTMPLAGYASDRITHRYGRRRGRAGVALAALAAAAILLAAGTRLADPATAAVIIALSISLVLATEGPFWAAAADLAGSSAGAAGGVMNTAGNLAGVASSALVPLLARRFGWPLVFYSASALALLAGLLWTGIRFPSHKPAQEEKWQSSPMLS